MNKIKHITAIFIVLGLIATGAYILPKLGLESALSQKEEAPAAAQNDTLAVPDTLPFVERMKTKLEVIQAKYSKVQKRDIWTLGKGRTIIYYLLQAQRFLESNGGKVLYMEELFNDPTVSQSAKLLSCIISIFQRFSSVLPHEQLESTLLGASSHSRLIA